MNVSAGRVVEWRGSSVETGIFKEPVDRRVMARRSGLDGDRQADLRVHGGTYKAIYAYAAEDYDWWRLELDRALPPGMFGENLTIEGLDDHDVCVGDVLRVGDALLQATQPRLPCYKLGIRFGDPTMVSRFMHGGRLGVYFRVLKEGLLGAGDAVEYVRRDAAVLPVAALARFLEPDGREPEALRRALRCAALPPTWIETLSKALAEHGT